MQRPKPRGMPRPERKNHIFRSRSGGPGQDRPRFLRRADPSTKCSIKDECGGCEFVNLDYENSLEKKYNRGIDTLTGTGVLKSTRLVAPVPSPKEFGYRSLFKLAVRPGTGKNFEDDNRFSIGLFKPNSHEIVEVDSCPLHAAPLKEMLPDLRDELEALHLTPYDETTKTGDLKYVVARSAHLTGEISLTFVVTSDVKRPLMVVASNLKGRGHKINACHMNINAEEGNAIFGPTTIRVRGAEGIRERICELDFSVGPTSFFQINPWQANNLYRRVESIAGLSDKKQVAWDLYCGTGQMGLILARAGYNVLGIEENPAAIENAEVNAKRNGLEKNTHFITGRVEDQSANIPEWATSPNLIVVNPSRRGLAAEAREHLKKLLSDTPNARLIYVSCEMETLARDLADLTDSSRQVRQLEAFDMFPQTSKMEWLAVID